MSKKTDLQKQAADLGLKVSARATIAELEVAIAQVAAPTKEAVVSPKTATTETAPAQTKAAEPQAVETETGKPVAKAGKRSAKSLAAAEARLAKENRKHQSQATAKATPQLTPPKPRQLRHGKKYLEAAKKIERTRVYDLSEAIDLIIATATTSFDSSVELVVGLGVNPKLAEQNIRDSVILPHGTGRKIKVAVFAPESELDKARQAGADIAGEDVFLQQLDKQKLDFDILITMPQLMVRLSKYAKVLGPKGLMPNPKSGTVTKDLERSIQEAKAGRVEYRVDEHGIVHLAIGKVSFGPDKIQANLEAVLTNLRANKPATVKGAYLKSIHLSSSMGPGVKVKIP